MKLQVMSDVHLEFDGKPNMKLKGGDVLLLAGDIAVAAFVGKQRTDKDARRMVPVFDAFFKEECAKYNRVFYIMGNHEHYRGIFDNTADNLREYLEGTNVKLLDKEFVDLDDNWQLFGGTLWTDYNRDDWFAKNNAKNNMADHSVISKFAVGSGPYGSYVGRFLPDDALLDHKDTLARFESGVFDMKRVGRPTVVMTHHAPTSKSSHPKWGGQSNPLNYAYYSELHETIMTHDNVKFWFHGHTHDSHDYMVGDCRVVCNPRGYHGHELNNGFKLDFEVEL